MILLIYNDCDDEPFVESWYDPFPFYELFLMDDVLDEEDEVELDEVDDDVFFNGEAALF